MTYRESIAYLNSFVNYERQDSYDYKKSFNLERMMRLASLLGDPQKGIRSIHVAGTKGKGSTCAIVYSILRKAGFNTGLYTSPHLVSLHERIRINDELIGKEDISRLLEKMKPAIDKMADDRPSFFEVYTALAYLYFKEKKADFVVYETGLGGRLDATNIIEPLVCAITPISYEHTDKLGNTLAQIAAEKAGIIKPGTVCILAPQEKEALDVFVRICEEKKAKLILVGKDIVFDEIGGDDRLELFNVRSMAREYPFLTMRLLGAHQLMNAATAIGAVEALGYKDIAVSSDAIRMGVENTKWDGRLEVVERRPYLILDGAQNRASANALAKAIKRSFRYKRLVLVLGISKDKDIKGIMEELLPISDSVVLTKSNIVERACEPSKIKEFIHSKDKEVILTSGVEEALSRARSMAAEDDLVLVTGSLFVVGEAKHACGKK